MQEGENERALLARLDFQNFDIIPLKRDRGYGKFRPYTRVPLSLHKVSFKLIGPTAQILLIRAPISGADREAVHDFRYTLSVVVCGTALEKRYIRMHSIRRNMRHYTNVNDSRYRIISNK